MLLRFVSVRINFYTFEDSALTNTKIMKRNFAFLFFWGLEQTFRFIRTGEINVLAIVLLVSVVITKNLVHVSISSLSKFNQWKTKILCTVNAFLDSLHSICTISYFHWQIFENGVLWDTIVIGNVTKFRKLFENFRQIALFSSKWHQSPLKLLHC